LTGTPRPQILEQRIAESRTLSWEEKNMPFVRIEHTVPNFEKWKQAFDSDPVDRKGSGVRRYQVLRAQDDPNLVHLIEAVPTDASDPVRNYRTIRRELEQYSPALADRPPTSPT
jgi:hypothetical protein